VTVDESRAVWAIRGGRAADAACLHALLGAWDMEGEFDPSESLVAERDGEVLGAARVEVVEERPWLRPIVVARGSERRGIGSALIAGLFKRYESLHVVARGSAAAFYERCGFSASTWNEVPSVLRSECETCQERQECCPRPMSRWGLEL